MKKTEVYKMYIDGEWVEAENGEVRPAINPANGESIAMVPAGSRQDARKAVEAAHRAFAWYRQTSVFERSDILKKVADAVGSYREELARTLSMEQGKPYYSEALGEAGAAACQFEEASEHCKWLLNGEVVPTQDKNKMAYTIIRPKGVFAIITPWNYPINIPSEYLAAALATGNTVVWNPASTTTLCAIRLMECLDKAGVPKGLINLVTGKGSVVGDELAKDKRVSGIGFTGSTEVGNMIAANAGAKAVVLELGGNGPSVILDDADLDLAIPPIVAGAFPNAGQICCATERVLVQRSLYKEVCDRLVAEAKKVVMGDPLEKGVTMGPMNNAETFRKNLEHAEDARKRGAKFLIGGKRAEEFDKGLYFEPTVVCDVPLDSLYNLDETFGPVIPVIPFDTDEEALSIANRHLPQETLYAVKERYASLPDYPEKPAWYVRERTGYSLIKGGTDDQSLLAMLLDSIDAYGAVCKAAREGREENQAGLCAFIERMVRDGNPSSATLNKVLGPEKAERFFRQMIMPKAYSDR